MPRARRASLLPVLIAHANAAVEVRPRARIHLTLGFVETPDLPFVARGAELWCEPTGRRLLGEFRDRLRRALPTALLVVSPAR